SYSSILHVFCLLFLLDRRSSCSTLFPYTTLFRSGSGRPASAGRLWGYTDVQGEGYRAGLWRPEGDPQLLVGPRHRAAGMGGRTPDRKSTRLNSSHVKISYAVFCLKKKIQKDKTQC